MAEQGLELAKYEAEMEEKKIEIEVQKQKVAKEMLFKAQLKAKQFDLLAEEEGETDSVGSLQNKIECGISLQPPLTKEERTTTWVANCHPDIPKEALNHSARELIPPRTNGSVENANPVREEQLKVTENVFTPSGENKKAADKNKLTNAHENSPAVLLKVTTLQAMQPVKISGNPTDFPIFRRRIRDNLEDGLLSDTQRIAFLPKFVSG